MSNSVLFKSHPTAFQYLPDLIDRTPMISFMTLAELDRWVLEAHWGEDRRQRLREYLERFVVLPYDRDLCTKWAEVTVAAQACGRRIDCADAWIAATALITDHQVSADRLPDSPADVYSMRSELPVMDP